MNILIVEDDLDLIHLVQRWLEREGHRVAHEVSGSTALAALAADPLPDLVLLDVMLPRVDGFTVLRRLRAEPRTQKLPVIILSSFDRHEDVARGLELGANDYIVKPPMEFQFLGRIARFAKKTP
jgi:two-component system cell cycle response regulator